MTALMALLLVIGTTLAVLGASHPQLFASRPPTPIANLHPTATIPRPSPTPTSRLLTAAQRQAIRTVVQRFCNDIQWRNDQDEYSLLSSVLRLKVSQNTFVKDEQFMDTSPDSLVACALIQDSSENTITGNIVIYLLQTKRESLPTISEAVALVYEDKAWRINAIGSSLNLANAYASS